MQFIRSTPLNLCLHPDTVVVHKTLQQNVALDNPLKTVLGGKKYSGKMWHSFYGCDVFMLFIPSCAGVAELKIDSKIYQTELFT